MPPFYSQKMQAEQHLPLRVQTDVDGPLDVTATRSEDGRTLMLHVVNTGSDALPTNLELTGFEGRKAETEVFVISGALNSRNTPQEPEKYKSTTSKIILNGNVPDYNFPAHSYTIMKFIR
jgi:alpha-L-arabinofuranosidase